MASPCSNRCYLLTKSTLIIEISKKFIPMDFLLILSVAPYAQAILPFQISSSKNVSNSTYLELQLHNNSFLRAKTWALSRHIRQTAHPANNGAMRVFSTSGSFIHCSNLATQWNAAWNNKSSAKDQLVDSASGDQKRKQANNMHQMSLVYWLQLGFNAIVSDCHCEKSGSSLVQGSVYISGN